MNSIPVNSITFREGVETTFEKEISQFFSPGPDAITPAPEVAVENSNAVTAIVKEDRKREIRSREHTGFSYGL